MPISSTEIAAITGGFNQQTMLGMQHSSMISQQFGGYAPNPMTQPVPTQGENITAQMMQFGANAGMNALSSPGMNQGFMGGISAMGRGVLGQVSYGVQQQQMMDASMRQSFRHGNQFGGAGFTPTQLGGMQRDMMQMSLERGPSGEQVTFEELGRLASNMGRMGMAESVRGVKDFNEKFKEMLKTVKTVAQELGTSLEEAQKMMTSMRGSGIFGMGTQKGMLGSMAKGAFAGGQFMSMSELSGAALVGSQMSRSIGGRGVHGAMAGMEAMTQVGVMRNMGIIGEQDVYNMTGMSGAEGRMALTQQDLGRDTQFLQSTHGRYFLASMMGKGGHLDPSSVNTMLAGGGTASDVYGKGRSRVMGNVYGFMRNEGNLRGEALAMGGGNLQASFYATELQRRGFDLSGDDERSMLALQHFTKMNKDEADYMMKKIRNLGRMQTFREEQAGEQQYYKDIDQQTRREGPEDLMKDIDMSRQRVNNELRKFGADLYKTWSSQIDGQIKKMSGEYERRLSHRLAGTVRALERGGVGAQIAMTQELGIGGGGGMAFAGARAEATRAFGQVGEGRAVDRSLFGRYSELKSMGLDLGGIRTAGDLSAARLGATQTAAAFAGEGNAFGSRESGFGDDLNRLLSLQSVEGTGSEFLGNFGKMLGGMEGDTAKSLSRQLASAKTEAEKAAIIKGVLTTTGNAGLFEGRIQAPGMMSGLGSSGFGSTEEANAVLGRQYMSGVDFRQLAGVEGKADRTVSGLIERGGLLAGRGGGVLERAFGGTRKLAMGAEDWLSKGISYGAAQSITGAPRGLLGLVGGGMATGVFDKVLGGARQDVTNQLYGQLGRGATTGEMSGMMEAFRSKESFTEFAGLVGGDFEQRDKARVGYQARMKKLQQGDMKLPSNQQEVIRMKGLLLSSEYEEYRRYHGGQEPPPDWFQKRAEQMKVDPSAVGSLISMARAGVGKTQIEQWEQTHNNLSERARKDLVTAEKEIEEIEKSDVSPEVKSFARKQRDFLKDKVDILKRGSSQNPEALYDDLRRFQGRTDAFEKETAAGEAGLSLEQLMEEGKKSSRFASTRLHGADQMERAGLGMGLRGARRRQGAGGERSFIAAQLGVGIGAREAAGMSVTAISERVMEETGLADSKIDDTEKRKFDEALKTVLSSKGGDKEKGAALAELRRSFSTTLTDAGREKQEQRAKETDPSYRMLTTINQSITDLKDKGILMQLEQMNVKLTQGFKLE